MKKTLLTIGLVVLTILNTMADNRLWMADFSIEPGETKRVSLMLDNDKVFTAFQVDLVLPEGISIVTKSNGKPNVTINTDRADDHQMVTNIRENGHVSILMMSLESTPIMGNSGEIVSMQFTASSDYSGTHQIELVDAELTEPDGTATNPADTYCTVTGPGGSVNPGNNRLWMEDFSIQPGETKRVSLMLDNDKVFTAFQVDLVLPEGISIVTKSNGKPNVTINTDRADDHQMVTNIRENGNVSILMMSLESTPIMGNSGEIVSMQFKASDTFSGIHQIELVDAELTEPDGTATNPEDTYCTVTGPSGPSTVLATSISMNQTTADVTEGATLQLVATVLPEDATDKTVAWTSSNSAVATVNANGLVTAVAPGTATITATTQDGTNLTATCAVTVPQPVVVPATFELSEKAFRIQLTQSRQVTVVTEGITDVTWSSNDATIASVDANGVITAHKNGIAIITATTANGAEAWCAVYSYLFGDVNEDNKVDVSDVNKVVNKILGK